MKKNRIILTAVAVIATAAFAFGQYIVGTAPPMPTQRGNDNTVIKVTYTATNFINASSGSNIVMNAIEIPKDKDVLIGFTGSSKTNIATFQLYYVLSPDGIDFDSPATKTIPFAARTGLTSNTVFRSYYTATNGIFGGARYIKFTILTNMLANVNDTFYPSNITFSYFR